MTITHSDTLRGNLSYFVCGANMDSDSGSAVLEFATNASFTTILASLRFSRPHAFGSGVVPVQVANPITPDINAVAGVCTAFRITSGNGAVMMQGTVTAVGGGGDIQLSSVNFANGDTISVTSLTYTAPP